MSALVGYVPTPESADATINYQGELSAPAERLQWEPQTFQNDLADQNGNYLAPYYGPGFEESAGDPKPKHHSLSYTIRRQGGWTPDTMSGVHAFIPWHGIDAHYGYQEPWNIQVANDKDVTSGVRVPWDYAIAAPARSARNYVV